MQIERVGSPQILTQGHPLCRVPSMSTRAAAARWPVVEEPAKSGRVEVGLQVAVGELQGGGGAFFPRTLEVEPEQRVAGELAEDIGGMKRGQAFAAVEGRRRAFEVRDEEGAPPVANLGRSAHCGPKRVLPESTQRCGSKRAMSCASSARPSWISGPSQSKQVISFSGGRCWQNVADQDKLGG